MASLNKDGTHISQDTFVHRNVQHAIQRADYTTDEKVQEFDPVLPA